MFKQAQYEGRSKILSKMAQFKISQDALDVVEAIGTRRFIALVKSGEIFKGFIGQQYLDWFETCPDSVNDFLADWYGRDEGESDDKAWKRTCGKVVDVLSLVLMVETEPEWYEKASKELKTVIDKALDDPDVRRSNPLAAKAIANYLAEAAEVAYFAGLVPEPLPGESLTL